MSVSPESKLQISKSVPNELVEKLDARGIRYVTMIYRADGVDGPQEMERS